jgi:hypothetical protein
MVAHWSVILSEPALDSQFWIILKCSEGKRCTVNSKLDLPRRLTIIAHCYINLETGDPNDSLGRSRRRAYSFTMMLCFAEATYDLYTVGLTLATCVWYLAFFLQVAIGD